jgi:hypothetical protein
VAQASSVFGKSIKDRPQIARRSADDFENFGCGGKLFQCLVALADNWASFGPAPAICADLGALRPFTAAFRRRGLTDADLAVERRFMDLSEG